MREIASARIFDTKWGEKGQKATQNLQSVRCRLSFIHGLFDTLGGQLITRRSETCVSS